MRVATFLFFAPSLALAQTIRPAPPVSPQSDSLVRIAHFDSAQKTAFPVFFASQLKQVLVEKSRTARDTALLNFGRKFNAITPAISLPTDTSSVDQAFRSLQRIETLRFNQDWTDLSRRYEEARTVETQAQAEAATRATTEANAAAAKEAKEAVAAPIAVGGVAWQQALIVGFASYLATRAKAEVLYSVVINANTSLCKRDHLTPSTCQLLAGGGEVPPAWSTLRAAVARDIQVLPEVLIAKYADTTNLAEAVRYARIGFQVGRLIERGEDPVWIAVGLLSAFPCPTDACKPHQVATLFHGLGHAVRLIGRDHLIVQRDTSLQRAINDLYRVLKPIYKEALDTSRARAIVAGTLVDIDAAIQDIRKLEAHLRTQPDDVATYARYVATAWNLMGSAQRLVPNAVDSTLQHQLDRAEPILQGALATMDRIRARDYAGAYVEAQLLAAKVLPANQQPAIFTTYGPFLAQLASATTPEQVEQTLSAVAAPVGSYRAKRGKGSSGFAINSFVGGQFGSERTAADPDNAKQQYGLFAPIGFEVSWGYDLGRTENSFGLFISMLDLGALLSVRDKDERLSVDQTKLVESGSEFGLKQVFSPGIYLTFGFGKKVPFVVGAGLSIHPDLRTVRAANDENDRGVPTTTRRLAIFAGADMPLFRF